MEGQESDVVLRHVEHPTYFPCFGQQVGSVLVIVGDIWANTSANELDDALIYSMRFLTITYHSHMFLIHLCPRKPTNHVEGTANQNPSLKVMKKQEFEQHYWSMVGKHTSKHKTL